MCGDTAAMGTPLDEMADLFDFGSASLPELSDALLASALTADDETQALVDTFMMTQEGVCPLHPHDTGCACREIFSDVSGPQMPNPIDGQEYDFSTWIPRYIKPKEPCSYCKSKHLDCFLTFQGQRTCSPCNALFRICSFVADKTEEDGPDPSRLMDTLSLVPEDTTQELGALTGIVQLKSYADPRYEDNERTSRRFPRAAVLTLKAWLHDHADNPYPTEDQKQALKQVTGLKLSQINNWLANARRRGKLMNKRAVSPSLRPTTGVSPIAVPSRKTVYRDGKTWDDLNPMERWQESPPENEPAHIQDIAQAVANTQYSSDDPETSNPGSYAGSGRNKKLSSGGSDSWSQFRAPSMTSQETGQSLLSSGSLSSAWSHGSKTSFGSLGSAAKRERRRRRRIPTKASATDNKDRSLRIFQCTFCTDTFKSKYDWTRHEKSLHLSLEKWICAPLGDEITDPATGQLKCVFCDELNPTKEHLQTHNYRACEEKGLESRTFFRKDHLRQHLRLMHGCKLIPSMESWKCESTFIKCRCGFCGVEFTNWQDRCDHISKEFRSGKRMKDWKGCRGLSPDVAAYVQNAMPPYLIGNEALSPFPFSASNAASMAHHMHPHMDLEVAIPNAESATLFDMPTSVAACPEGLASALIHMNKRMSTLSPPFSSSPAGSGTRTRTFTPNGISTCWEVLTIRLGNFVKEQHDLGFPMTDEQLQRQARIILYDDEDPWNQTAADNPEWLSLFKKAHGLGSVEGSAESRTLNRYALIEDLHIDIGDLNFNNVFADGGGWDDSTNLLLDDTAMGGMTTVMEVADGTPGMNLSI